MTFEITHRATTDWREYVELRTDKQALSFSRATDGSVNTLILNASHRAYRGGGRVFKSVDAALEGYKSPEVKAMIRACVDVIEGRL